MKQHPLPAAGDASHSASLAATRSRWSRLPVAVLVLALLAAVLHLAPIWRAQAETPSGWVFTGNLANSPDQMQYHVLALRSQVTGPVVDNRMTTEPNTPHIPMLFYYAVGKLASWSGISVPYATDYVGAVFAFILVFLLFYLVRHFLLSRYQTWWTLLVILLGGGLGAHMLILNQFHTARSNPVFKMLVTDGLKDAIVFDNYRNHYIFTTLLDAHFLVFTVIALLAIVSFYYALRSFSLLKVLLAAALFGVATVLHIYEGVTLVFIGAGVSFLLWRKGLLTGQALITLFACALAAGVATIWQMYLFKTSGLDIPAWRAQAIYFSELLLAYPVAWALMAWGLGDYWRRAGFNECFLLGWALGCIVLTLSGPFYPYPDRGVMTLQVPIYIIAAAIFFAHRERVGIVAALVLLFVLGATPVYKSWERWSRADFESQATGVPRPYTWMSPEHQEVANILHRRGTEHDVLAVDKVRPSYQSDDLWLAPGFPGKLYCGHYALTPQYPRKREEIEALLEASDPSVATEILQRTGIRFLYVASDRMPDRLKGIPGLVPLHEASIGTLFEYAPASGRN